jgi:hypothetical protein
LPATSDAWEALFEAIPDGWTVNKPFYDRARRTWQMYTFDQREGSKAHTRAPGRLRHRPRSWLCSRWRGACVRSALVECRSEATELDVARARLITYPPADGAFYEYTVKCYDYGIDTPTQLQAAIRARYPQAVVQPSRPESNGETRWHVYRDDSVGAW